MSPKQRDRESFFKYVIPYLAIATSSEVELYEKQPDTSDEIPIFLESLWKNRKEIPDENFDPMAPIGYVPEDSAMWVRTDNEEMILVITKILQAQDRLETTGALEKFKKLHLKERPLFNLTLACPTVEPFKPWRDPNNRNPMLNLNQYKKTAKKLKAMDFPIEEIAYQGQVIIGYKNGINRYWLGIRDDDEIQELETKSLGNDKDLKAHRERLKEKFKNWKEAHKAWERGKGEKPTKEPPPTHDPWLRATLFKHYSERCSTQLENKPWFRPFPPASLLSWLKSRENDRNAPSVFDHFDEDSDRLQGFCADLLLNILEVPEKENQEPDECGDDDPCALKFADLKKGDDLEPARFSESTQGLCFPDAILRFPEKGQGDLSGSFVVIHLPFIDDDCECPERKIKMALRKQLRQVDDWARANQLTKTAKQSNIIITTNKERVKVEKALNSIKEVGREHFEGFFLVMDRKVILEHLSNHRDVWEQWFGCGRLDRHNREHIQRSCFERLRGQLCTGLTDTEIEQLLKEDGLGSEKIPYDYRYLPQTLKLACAAPKGTIGSNPEWTDVNEDDLLDLLSDRSKRVVLLVNAPARKEKTTFMYQLANELAKCERGVLPVLLAGLIENDSSPAVSWVKLKTRSADVLKMVDGGAGHKSTVGRMLEQGHAVVFIDDLDKMESRFRELIIGLLPPANLPVKIVVTCQEGSRASEYLGWTHVVRFMAADKPQEQEVPDIPSPSPHKKIPPPEYADLRGSDDFLSRIHGYSDDEFLRLLESCETWQPQSQWKALSAVAKKSLSILAESISEILIVADTSFIQPALENPSWLQKTLMDWLAIGCELTRRCGRRVVHRILFYPKEAHNYRRHFLQLQMAIHAQLWHGCVLHVVFVPPATDVVELAALFEGATLIEAGIVMGTPNFHSTTFSGLEITENRAAATKFGKRQAYRLESYREAATLFYGVNDFTSPGVTPLPGMDAYLRYAWRCPSCTASIRPCLNVSEPRPPGVTDFLYYTGTCDHCNLTLPLLTSSNPLDMINVELSGILKKKSCPDASRTLSEFPQWIEELPPKPGITSPEMLRQLLASVDE